MMKRGRTGFESLRPYFSRVVRFGKSKTNWLLINESIKNKIIAV